MQRIPPESLPEDKRYNPLQINAYVLFKALPQVRRYSQAELVRAMDLLFQCNQRLVSSNLDEALVAAADPRADCLPDLHSRHRAARHCLKMPGPTAPNQTPAKILVLTGDRFACVKIVGRANFASSIDFKNLVDSLRQKGLPIW